MKSLIKFLNQSLINLWFKTSKILFLLLILLQIFPIAKAQNYKVDYKKLPADLLIGNEPIITCILEEPNSEVKLYESIIQDAAIKDKFTIYSTDVLNENKSILGISEFNPEEKKFLKALNETLGIEYVIEWKSIPDESAFQLNVFSTKEYKKIYSNKFYASINSNPALDVKNLMVENLEPIYTVAFGELEITSVPGEAKFKLYKDTALVKEWSGKEKQKIESGSYNLTTEAYGYKSDIREIEIAGENPIIISIKLEHDISLLPNISSLNNLVSNIEFELEVEQLKIFYDLSGDKENEYNITLVLTERATNNINEIKQISGDVENVKPGKNKVIIWQFRKEIENNINLKNYDLKISAEKKGGIAWYLYAGGGAVVAGGVLAIILGGGKEGNGDVAERQKIGSPPIRPTGN